MNFERRVRKTEVLPSDEYWNVFGIFGELSVKIAEFKPFAEKKAKIRWRKMVARLEANEVILGATLTSRGTVAFIVV